MDEIGRDGWFCLGALAFDIGECSHQIFHFRLPSYSISDKEPSIFVELHEVLLVLPNTPESIPKIGKKRRLFNLGLEYNRLSNYLFNGE